VQAPEAGPSLSEATRQCNARSSAASADGEPIGSPMRPPDAADRSIMACRLPGRTSPGATGGGMAPARRCSRPVRAVRAWAPWCGAVRWKAGRLLFLFREPAGASRIQRFEVARQRAVAHGSGASKSLAPPRRSGRARPEPTAALQVRSSRAFCGHGGMGFAFPARPSRQDGLMALLDLATSPWHPSFLRSRRTTQTASPILGPNVVFKCMDSGRFPDASGAGIGLRYIGLTPRVGE